MPLQHQEHETGHGQTPTASSRGHKLLRLNREPFSLAVRHPPGAGFGASRAVRAAESERLLWVSRRRPSPESEATAKLRLERIGA